MKTKSKALLMTLCAVLLVAASVLGTMAYLTSTDKVTNTFAIGKIAITLDEAQVDDNGKALENAARVKANTYKLMPGHKYDKDPTVHVKKGSEDAYIFVKVENGISAFEADTKIAAQIAAERWKALDGVANVYYKEYSKDADKNVDLVVFKNFTIAEGAESVSGWDTATNANITITAYAVQQDGFATAKAAWDAAKFN